VRTFVSVYRHDPVRLLFVRRVLPVLAWLILVASLLVPALVLGNLWRGLAPEAREAVLIYFAGMALVMLTAPAMLFYLVRQLRLDMLETEWRLDDTGLERRRGRAVARRRWGEVQRLDRIGLGRLQLARVRSDAGNLWFDGSMVDASADARLEWGVARMSIRYPDGRTRPLEIEACELYQAIAERVRSVG
jgi:hypothetical protein